jgi:hypothetical protein
MANPIVDRLLRRALRRSTLWVALRHRVAFRDVDRLRIAIQQAGRFGRCIGQLGSGFGSGEPFEHGIPERGHGPEPRLEDTPAAAASPRPRTSDSLPASAVHSRRIKGARNREHQSQGEGRKPGSPGTLYTAQGNPVPYPE